ncbi:MAG: YifB family Mg chelatase-like AAA ATPase, partial [Myxococcales bacterium]|nr:YifB family Mg chelatase-like AAA ATPase [Myxococcales bacterium]
MLATVHAGALVGIDAVPVLVEADFTNGLPGFDIVGLPEAAVRESRVRVRAALDANGFTLPKRRLLLNLAPGDLRKGGAGFDLAIAIAVLAACGACPSDALENVVFVGELSLAGELRAVRGALAHVRSALTAGRARIIAPAANGHELALATGIDVRVASHLAEVVAHLKGHESLSVAETNPSHNDPHADADDLRDVIGQGVARRALEIAAAGPHHLLFVGPPGTGKTLLARRLPSILPAPSAAERLDIATIAGVAGLAGNATASGARPFRAPHSLASSVALLGGGEPVRPGEVTPAHGGVLFLDELGEFPPSVLDALRQPLEDGVIHLSRARFSAVLPARVLLVAALNPCPCGAAGRPGACRCTDAALARYHRRLSGPLVDRFDLRVVVCRPSPEQLLGRVAGEPSAAVAARVREVRGRA